MAPARYVVGLPLMGLPCSAHPGRNIVPLAGAIGLPCVPGMSQPPFWHDIAARMRAAWEAHQGQTDDVSGRGHASEPASSLAERMRDAAQGIDREALAERAAELQRERLAEDRQRVEEAERLQERERLRELEQEVRHRDRGMDHGL